MDAGVERLRREDENHLPPTLEHLNSDEKLCAYVKRIQAGEHLKFYGREHRRQAQLELLGVIKPDEEGYCAIRNRIYELSLTGSDVPRMTPVPSLRKSMPNPELIEALQRRTLALFIGADLPCEVTGLPSRAALARELARCKGLDESLSLAEVVQRVGQTGNRWEFTAFIRDALDTAGKSPQPFHRRIVELAKSYRIETLITTTYDNLLELAFQEAGIGINRVVRGGDVNFIRPGRPTLVKLYGDAQQPDTLVVTDRDHSDLLRDREREPLMDEAHRLRRPAWFTRGRRADTAGSRHCHFRHGSVWNSERAWDPICAGRPLGASHHTIHFAITDGRKRYGNQTWLPGLQGMPCRGRH